MSTRLSGDAQRLDDARDALSRHAWAEAHAYVADAVERDDPDWLVALAEASWWLSRLEDCITARQRAFELYDERGDHQQAGQCAVWLYEHHCFRAKPVIGRGWLQRGRRALHDDRRCVPYGNLLLREAECDHGAGELDKAWERATEALHLGRELRSADLEAEALQTLGRILIDKGEPHEGLAHLDEAMLYVVEGKLGPYSSGKVYCSLVSACEAIGDIHRASQWTDAVAEWADHHPVSMFPGICRVHRADLLQWRGEWDRAEAEARQACAELEFMHLPIAAEGFVQVAEIRRRLGDFEGAEAAYERAQELGGQPLAGIALLRLAQGRRKAAAKVIAPALDEGTRHRLVRGKLLPVYVQVMVEVGELERARAGAEELATTAEEYQSPVLLAAAATARGRVELAAGSPEMAAPQLRQAAERWNELDAPYELAQTRLLQGHVCRASGDAEEANNAFAKAEAIFESLGAVGDVLASREARVGASLPRGLSERELEVLRLVAKGRTNRQIATELQLSEKTVARHLSNIFLKIEVGSRAGATAFAFEQELVGPD